jgi:hypothetical protein
MNLRKATLFLIFGLAYTLLDTAALDLFPALDHFQLTSIRNIILSAISLAEPLAMILFACLFLGEVRPRDGLLRYSLVSVILLTGVVIPFWPLLCWPNGPGLGQRLLFSVFPLLDSVAVLLFVISLARLVADGSPLRTPLRALAWALAVRLVLGTAVTGYRSLHRVTGWESGPLPIMRPLSLVVFLCIYGSALWFLVRFRRLGSYVDLVPR